MLLYAERLAYSDRSETTELSGGEGRGKWEKGGRKVERLLVFPLSCFQPPNNLKAPRKPQREAIFPPSSKGR